MTKPGRASNGRFAKGNPGGPGRPPRPVEREYLRALNEAVSLDDWKDVVGAALKKAKEGDAESRAWLEKYLIGSQPARLIDLAAEDVRNGIYHESSYELLAALARSVLRIRNMTNEESDAMLQANLLIGEAARGAASADAEADE
jgi:hypothetical protein